jgi:ribosomal protein S18 acetylase RimI-like enzyme
VDIAIAAGERSRGAGRRLFEEWQQEAAALSRPIALTVFRGNARARGLYARLGFIVVGETDTHVNMEWRP